MTPNWRHLPHPIGKQPSWRESPRCIPCYGLLIHMVTTLNWCKEKCVAKALWNWKHKARLVNGNNISFTTMEHTPPERLIMVKRQATPRTFAIWHGMWYCAICEQSWNNYENPLVESSKWKEFWRCSKTIPKRPLADKFGMHWNDSLKSNKNLNSSSNL